MDNIFLKSQWKSQQKKHKNTFILSTDFTILVHSVVTSNLVNPLIRRSISCTLRQGATDQYFVVEISLENRKLYFVIKGWSLVYSRVIRCNFPLKLSIYRLSPTESVLGRARNIRHRSTFHTHFQSNENAQLIMLEVFETCHSQHLPFPLWSLLLFLLIAL